MAYLPHFLSRIIVAGILVNILSPSTGVVNEILGYFGLERIFFMADRQSALFASRTVQAYKSSSVGPQIFGEEMNFVELRGTKAGSSIKKGELRIFTEMAGQLTDISPVMGKKPVGAHGAHLRHFIDVVQLRAEPILTPEHGVDMIKILTALYQSAELGREVRL